MSLLHWKFDNTHADVLLNSRHGTHALHTTCITNTTEKMSGIVITICVILVGFIGKTIDNASGDIGDEVNDDVVR